MLLSRIKTWNAIAMSKLGKNIIKKSDNKYY